MARHCRRPFRRVALSRRAARTLDRRARLRARYPRRLRHGMFCDFLRETDERRRLAVPHQSAGMARARRIGPLVLQSIPRPFSRALAAARLRHAANDRDSLRKIRRAGRRRRPQRVGDGRDFSRECRTPFHEQTELNSPIVIVLFFLAYWPYKAYFPNTPRTLLLLQRNPLPQFPILIVNSHVHVLVRKNGLRNLPRLSLLKPLIEIRAVLNETNFNPTACLRQSNHVVRHVANLFDFIRKALHHLVRNFRRIENLDITQLRLVHSTLRRNRPAGGRRRLLSREVCPESQRRQERHHPRQFERVQPARFARRRQNKSREKS